MNFFPDGGDTREAISICAGCPVRVDCLMFGLREPDGIWGGLSLAKRKQLVKLRAMLATDPDNQANATDVALLIRAGADTTQLAIVCRIESGQIEDLARRGLAAMEAASSDLSRRIAEGDPTVQHGRPSSYNAGCRCQPCRDEMASRARKRTAAKGAAS